MKRNLLILSWVLVVITIILFVFHRSNSGKYEEIILKDENLRILVERSTGQVKYYWNEPVSSIIAGPTNPPTKLRGQFNKFDQAGDTLPPLQPRWEFPINEAQRRTLQEAYERQSADNNFLWKIKCFYRRHILWPK